MLRLDSLASRILLLHVVALTVTAVILPLILFWFLNRETDRLHEEAMRRQAEAVAEHISVGADGKLELELPQDLRDLYSAAYGRYAYAVIDTSGEVLFASSKTRAALLPTGAVATAGSESISGASLERTIGDHALNVQVAEDLSHRDVIIDDIVANFFCSVGWITVPILLLLLAWDIVIFRRAVRPLVEASERAATIGPARTDIRLPLQGIPREILPLVEAVNQAFDRLEHGYREQRRFTADAAHELRTPLAILSARIDTIGPLPANKDLHRNIESMSRIVGQLLDVAETDAMRLAPDEVADLAMIAAEVVEAIAPLALGADKEIELLGADAPARIHGNAEMVRRAVRNLVENAIRHTPTGTAVVVDVAGDGSVSVRDHGPGIARADRDLIFKRFWRGDRNRSDGAGLGLAIVKNVVDEHRGTIEVVNAPGGGALFIARFCRSASEMLDDRPPALPG